MYPVLFDINVNSNVQRSSGGRTWENPQVFYVNADPILQDHSLMLAKYSNISESVITTNNIEWDTS